MKRTFLAVTTAIGFLGAFITCATGTVIDTPVGDDPIEIVEPDPPPFVDPPPLRAGSPRLPDYGRAEPRFPYLPGEDRHQSRSVGTVTEGYLVNSRPLPLPHPHLQILPRQFQRHLQYTSDPMIGLLDDAARHVGEKYPESSIYLGNFGRRGGGSIPHSVSHNSGRDGDIGFFVTDEQGNAVPTPDLLPFDAHGVYDGAVYEDGDFTDMVLHFDAPRNWRLVEGLIESRAADLQYIFVSNPLRQQLLAEARRQNASSTTIDHARRILVQPGGNTLPHNDHFHLRIHCTTRDLASGCREHGRKGPTLEVDGARVRQVLEDADRLLDSDDPELRRTAIRRLALMENHNLYHRIAALLDDPDPRVRAAATRPLREHEPATQALIDRLDAEQDPRVFAELVDALAHSGPSATIALIAALQRDKHLEFAPSVTVSSAVLVADALARQGRPEPVPDLIAALDTADPAARLQIAHTLRILTNHQLTTNEAIRDHRRADEAIEAWAAWWDDFGDRDRDQWVAAGFQQAGYDIDDLSEQDVWELCRAISADRHLNFNAQRILKRISGQSPGSYGWDPYDASFYWRRWFERRQDEMALPPIPVELSTADGYTPPE